MKGILGVFFFMCLLPITTQCTSKKKNGVITTNKISLKVEETVSIPFLGTPRVFDINTNGVFAFYDRQQEVFGFFNKKGELLNQFNRETDDNEGYGPYMLGASFYKEDLLIVRGIRGLYVYNMKGTLQEKHYFNIENTPNEGLKCYPIEPDKVLIRMNRNLDSVSPIEPNYYHALRLFGLANLKDNVVSSFIGFEPGSPYLSKTDIVPHLGVNMTYNKSTDELYTIYSNEATCYVYNYANNILSFSRKFDLSPHSFVSQRVPPNTSQVMKIKVSFTNDEYQGIWTQGDRVITTYAKGQSEEYSNAQLENMGFQLPQSTNGSEVEATFNNTNLEKIHELYVQVFENGKKAGADLRLPADIAELSLVLPNGKLFLRKQHASLNEEGTTFYLASIVTD